MAPRVIVQLSDPHLRADMPERAEALARAVDGVLALGVQPIAVVLSGDVADLGEPAAYAVARREVERCGAPVVVLPGNKDDRAALRAAFALPGAGAERVHSVLGAGGLRIVACDTQIPGELAGDLDVDWLRECLAEDSVTPTLIAMHHPPYRVGVTAMDEIGLPAGQRAALDALLHDAPAVLRVVAGHVHRASFGTVGGVPACTCPSVSFALALDLAQGGLSPAAEPAGFLVHQLVDGDLVTHVVPVPTA